MIAPIFNKPLHEITMSDVATYFSVEREESQTLEFKSGGVDYKDIFKEIAAFLNTDGGILIIGAPRETKRIEEGKEIKFCIGPPDLNRSIRSREVLAQQIAANINPQPYGIVVHELLSPAGNVFILQIPASSTPPHQVASEGRYYIRTGSDSVPAGHDVVRQLFFKTTAPLLTAQLVAGRSGDADLLDFSFSNISSVTAHEVQVQVELHGCESAEVRDGQFEKHILPGSNRLVLRHSARFGTDLPQGATLYHQVLAAAADHEYVVKITFWCEGVAAQSAYWLVDAAAVRRFDLSRVEDILELQAYVSIPGRRIDRF